MPLSTEYIITLLKTPKIGNVTTKLVNSLANFKITHVNELLDLLVDLKGKYPKIPLPQLNDLVKGYETAETIIENCGRKGIVILDINDELYPSRLKRLNDFPIVSYAKGNISALNSEHSLAVIGTREPTPFGFKAGKRIASIMGSHSFTIVSGLAVGCDTAGHLGALEANAPTVAVLASGVDLIYPKENTGLAEDILQKGGVYFSEYEPGMRPMKSSFVERDRLQSGLSDALIVIETDIKGGTMHTVGFAKKQNIPIACLSSHPENLQNHDKIRGNKYLIEQGAFALGNPEQISEFIKLINPDIKVTLETNPVLKEKSSQTLQSNFSINLQSENNSSESYNISESENTEAIKVSEKENIKDNLNLNVIDETKKIINEITNEEYPILILEVKEKLSKIELLLERLLEEQTKGNDKLQEFINITTKVKMKPAAEDSKKSQYKLI